MSPTEARSIIRELAEAGVQLGNDPADGAAGRRAAGATPLAETG